jgi:hypothetical protein
MVAPGKYPIGLPIPLVARVEDDQGRARRVNGVVSASGFEAWPFPVLRGHGSGFLPAATNAGVLDYQAQLSSLRDSRLIQIESGTAWTTAKGGLSGAVFWPEDSRVHLNGSLTIPAGATLTIGAGSVIKVDPLVNITNSGRLVIQGTRERPVVVTATNWVGPEVRAHAWGGLIMRGSAAWLEANGAIFVGGGGAADFSFSPGSSHRDEQPVFLLQNGARAYLTNCYILNTAGQLGNGYQSDLTLDHCLVQRAITAGEFVGGTILINHSALIEFPADDGVVNADIADADYDGIYFTEGTHIIRDSLIGFAKDDAIDSGSGGAGTVLVTNCWIESALHEGLAWSGGGRQTWTYDTVILNCGQGLECGYSLTAGSPECYAERVLSIANSIGARFGDNYDWDYWGSLRMINSILLHNHRDAWGMNWDNWQYGIPTPTGEFAMDLRTNLFTAPNPNHPFNTVWDPARDGSLLARWMSAPAGASVGIGFAVRTNQFALVDLLHQGAPVRLSSFSTNVVLVDYTFETGGQPLASGALVFAPGETVKRIYPSGFDLSRHAVVDLVLNNTGHGELTGLTRITFTGPVARPQISLALATNRIAGSRLIEGVLARLSTPSALPVTLNYRYEAPGLVLSSGTLVFNPMETSKLIRPELNALEHETVVLSVNQPTNAVLEGFTEVVYNRPPLEVRLGLNAVQQPLDTFTNGVAVALNSPAPSGVGVDYQIAISGTVLAQGTLDFAPGEIAKTLPLSLVEPGGADVVRVSLSQPVRVACAGVTNAYYVRTSVSPPPPRTPLVQRGATWRYRDLVSDPGPQWAQTGFDDSGWLSGRAQLGFGESDQATTLSNRQQITSHFRHAFTVPDPAPIATLSLWLLRDDGGVVYLNGNEVFRSPNMPSGPIGLDTLAQSPLGENTVDEAVLSATGLQRGTNLVAVEIHQADPDSSDVSFDLELVGIEAPAPTPPQRLYWAIFEDEKVLAWGEPSFVLEESKALTGPWSVTATTSPVFPGFTDGERFYRLHQR